MWNACGTRAPSCLLTDIKKLIVKAMVIETFFVFVEKNAQHIAICSFLAFVSGVFFWLFSRMIRRGAWLLCAAIFNLLMFYGCALSVSLASPWRISM